MDATSALDHVGPEGTDAAKLKECFLSDLESVVNIDVTAQPVLIALLNKALGNGNVPPPLRALYERLPLGQCGGQTTRSVRQSFA